MDFETRVTMRQRIQDVATDWLNTQRIVVRLEGHAATWDRPDRSNVRRLLRDMVKKGQLEARFIETPGMTQYRVPKDQFPLLRRGED